MQGALTGGEDLTAVSIAVLREGCIGETIGAMFAMASLSTATDPAVKASLEGAVGDAAVWRAHGRSLPARQRRLMRRAALRVVRPCFAALVRPVDGSAQPPMV